MQTIVDLKGKHILITGAASGIGRASAILASQFGAKLTLIDRNPQKISETLSLLEGNDHDFFVMDLATISEIDQKISNAIQKRGPIDGFVHCAGIGQNRPISLTKPDFLQEIMTVNFTAFAEILRSLSKKKHSNNGASFIGISSVAAFKGGKAQGAYAASKAAMSGFIHPAAKEFAARQCRVNCIAFGMIATEMYKNFKAAGGTEEQLTEQYLGIGSTIDAANIICFLLSDASKFITGTTLVADGGYLS